MWKKRIGPKCVAWMKPLDLRDSEAAMQSEQAPRRVRRLENKEKANNTPPHTHTHKPYKK